MTPRVQLILTNSSKLVFFFSSKSYSLYMRCCLQVLTFENFKNRGLVCLSHSNTEHLLDLLEDAQATLALMLTSRHIGPLRDEAAAWAIKLKEISEVLEQVQLYERTEAR